MKTKLENLWYSIRSTYWFVPTLMTAAAVALAFLSIFIDQNVPGKQLTPFSLLFADRAEGARPLLSAIVGSMITVAGVVFSVTIVALTLASSQFGPRLLQNFMRDTGNQVVLGTFISTFIYCLLVLLTIGGTEQQPFVPHISVTVGVLLAVASVGVLIYFIHHVAASIQATSIIIRVTHDLDSVFHRLHSNGVGQGAAAASHEDSDEGMHHVPQGFDQESCQVLAPHSGYVQAIEKGTLLSVAVERDLILRIEQRPGKFVVQGIPLLSAWPGDRLDDKLLDRLAATFILGRQRTHEQDAEFAVDQLVEIAVRALSTGINDEFTAMMCVDRLGDALARLAQHPLPSPYRYDSDGKLRIIDRLVTFSDVMDSAFNQVRQNVSGHPAVSIRMLEVMKVIAEYARTNEDRDAVLRHAGMVRRGSILSLTEENDKKDVEARYQLIVQAMDRA